MARLRIKEEALKQGLKQKDVIVASGVSHQLMNRYWNNYTRSVVLDELQKIAHALGVKMGDLLVADEDEQAIDEEEVERVKAQAWAAA